jgi:(E)-4-hydroxy-3-methylbut-2-enyl-diphosphate synthase
VRCAVPDEAAAAALTDIKAKLKSDCIVIPIVADIHFDYRLALAAIENGADKVRINPGNIGDEGKLRAVVKSAETAGIPIRIGVNGGSLEKDILSRHGGATAAALSQSALRNIERVASMGFEDIVVSVKSSDVVTGNEALRLLAPNTDLPLHIGVTEAGSGARALAKSAIGIGALLAEGIGDTIRVSLTGDPVREIAAARDILAALDLLPGAVNVISCPTCGRCKTDLARISGEVNAVAEKIERERMSAARAGKSVGALTVAVMGCAVNGPGEAAGADVGVACGEGRAVIFKGGKKLKAVAPDEIVSALKEEMVGD